MASNRRRIQRHRERQGRAPLYTPIPTRDDLRRTLMRRFHQDPHAEQANDVLIVTREDFPEVLSEVLYAITAYSKQWHRRNACDLPDADHELRGWL